MSVDDPAHLTTLLPHLAALLVEVPLEAPVAVGIRLAPREPGVSRGAIIDRLGPGATGSPVEFLFRHLDCTDILCALCGFVAPPDWDAFGVIAPGHGGPLDDRRAPQVEVTACALVDRQGRVVSEVRTLDGVVLCSGPTIGRVIDACHRVLGLGTLPSVCGPEVWLGLRWVDRVLATVLDADLGSPPPWSLLAALDDLAPPPGSREPYRSFSWRALRTACALGEIEVPGISPCTADWMDDGMFGREAIAFFAPLADTLGDLRGLVPSATFDSIVERVSDRLAA